MADDRSAEVPLLRITLEAHQELMIMKMRYIFIRLFLPLYKFLDCFPISVKNGIGILIEIEGNLHSAFFGRQIDPLALEFKAAMSHYVNVGNQT